MNKRLSLRECSNSHINKINNITDTKIRTITTKSEKIGDYPQKVLPNNLITSHDKNKLRILPQFSLIQRKKISPQQTSIQLKSDEPLLPPIVTENCLSSDYCTTISSTHVSEGKSQNSNHLTDDQLSESIQKLKLRLKLAYFKYKTNQTNLKFCELKNRRYEKKSFNKKFIKSSNHIHTLKTPTKPLLSTMGTTPLSFKAAKSLLQLFNGSTQLHTRLTEDI